MYIISKVIGRLFSILNRKIQGRSEIRNLFLVLTKLFWSTLEINFIFPHIHVHTRLEHIVLVNLTRIPGWFNQAIWLY